MRTRTEGGDLVSPVRLLEMLEFRFGAFEALASTSLELGRKRPAFGVPMDRPTAEAIMEFADDLKQAYEAALVWTQASMARGSSASAEAEHGPAAGSEGAATADGARLAVVPV